MWWLVAVVAFVALVATYLTWIAARVDRLHHRADAAYAALEARLAQRAEAAVSLAEVDLGLGAKATALRAAATAALCPGPDGREVTENQLTRQLRDCTVRVRISESWPALESWSPVESEPGPGGAQIDEDPVTAAIVEVVTVSRRVELARQVHSDLVRETLAARRRLVVRLLGLDRRHGRPAYFDIEDPVLDG